eukprot:11044294-Heterocapsa_arctica.AAC.1
MASLGGLDLLRRAGEHRSFGRIELRRAARPLLEGALTDPGHLGRALREDLEDGLQGPVGDHRLAGERVHRLLRLLVELRDGPWEADVDQDGHVPGVVPGAVLLHTAPVLA